MSRTTLSFKLFFVLTLVVFLVYVFAQNDIAEAKRLNANMVNKNILRQLERNDYKYKDNIDVLNLSKKTLMAKQVNARIRKHISTSEITGGKNDEKLHIAKRQIIAPGYYEAECSEKKPCKEGKYCNLLYCEDCHKEKMACAREKQCCKGMECTFGRCEKKSKGDPGTFCEKDSDCKSDSCCVLEPTVNTLLPICKPKLAEYHQCASVLYRKVWIGEKPDCGPCKQGLECAQKGILASHQVCMKPKK
ncbi:dickkopf-related protein 3-like [Actinia tenebrosa]|uniref:Dickkopf-related protein 3-like n=1 Tax=Actinia tenebrosa TaxID=6105 RepID=A0A6P8IUS9_ACTTE|nr:dickkopf-related protein 3-like [Actinia tenebrosa]